MELTLKKLIEKLASQQADLVSKIQVGQEELTESEMEQLDSFLKAEQANDPESTINPISLQTLLQELKAESYKAPARDPR